MHCTGLALHEFAITTITADAQAIVRLVRRLGRRTNTLLLRTGTLFD